MASLPLLAGTGGPAGAAAPSPTLPWFSKVSTYHTSGGGAEIVAGLSNGDRVFYTDADADEVGAVDITDPANPTELFTIPVDGEPTSVAVTPGGAVGVAVVSNDPSSEVVAFDTQTGAVLREIPLLGQPDSISINPGGKFAAIAIENEETPAVPGMLAIIKIKDQDDPSTWSFPANVPLTGLADIDPDDPEPEFVDTYKNIAAVTLQENNHIVLVDLKSRTVINDFSAGMTTQTADLTEDSEISFTETLTDAPLVPDGIAFDRKGNLFTADEGEADLTGGRGFSVFNQAGAMLWHQSDFEERIVEHSHYADGRSANKGVEAENIEYGSFGNRSLVFVAAERAKSVSVYEIPTSGTPIFRQLLPTQVEPEGVLALPGRNLVMSADEGSGTLSIFEGSGLPPAYPDVVSGSVDLPWGALSGLANGMDASTAYGVSDNALLQSRIFELDTTGDPFEVTGVLPLVDDGSNVNADLEGISTRLDGSGAPDPGLGWWVVSEGNGAALNDKLMAVDAAGEVTETVELPPAVDAVALRWGFEGVTVTGSGASEQVYVAFQREWLDDPLGLVRIGRYTPSTGEWAFFHYELDVASSNYTALNTGLSEIVAIDDTTFAVIERDGKSGPAAALKKIYTFSIDGVTPTPCAAIDVTCVVDASAEVTDKTLLRDLLVEDELTLEKIEGMIWDGARWIVVNDNDGFGETRVVTF